MSVQAVLQKFYLLNQKKAVKLEHKAIDAFVRGLLITEKYLYYGISAGIGRTASQFTNKDSLLFCVNKSNGEIKKIPIPSFCDNIYGIDSDWISNMILFFNKKSN